MSETTTPTGVRVIATAPDGTERNITEGVQALYDLVIQSMDWGSGFLSVEEVRPVVDLAKFCGFKDYEQAEDYMAVEVVKEKQRHCDHSRWRVDRVRDPQYVWRTCEECGYQHVVPASAVLHDLLEQQQAETGRS